MTLEELKAEAEKLGYNVVKKPVKTGRKLACVCGSHRFWNNVQFDKDRHVSECYVQCRCCKLEGPHIERNHMRRDEAFAEATKAWNEMIMAKSKEEQKDD